MKEKIIDVTGIGVSTLDILNLVEHFPSNEEVIKSIACEIDGGGPVSTAIAALANLGAKTAMIDVLGNDWRGKRILQKYIDSGVDTSNLKIVESGESSLATILINRSDASRAIIFSDGSIPELNENDIDEELIARSKILHLNGRHLSASLKACVYAKKWGTKISFEGGAYRFRPELITLIRLADILIVSKNFAQNYSNEILIDKMAESFLENNHEIIVITEGINGSWLFTKDIWKFHQKAFLLEETIDTTGCGDCFHGAFLYGITNGFDLPKTIEFASAAAALNSTKIGGRAGLPSVDNVFKLIDKSNK